ncbi:MAG: hypothetical protein RR206_04915 [Bacteroidaceae bacterium]
MANKKERYVCWLLVAPYVKQYLLTNFRVDDPDWDDLVNISQDKYLNVLFRSRLTKPSNKYNKRIEQNSTYKYRKCKISLEISKSDFYQYGWALSPTDASVLANTMEIRCRTILLTYLSALYMVLPSLSECINHFYERFNFNETTWPVDSIRRIWTREGCINKTTLKTDLTEKIDKIILVQLFKHGTISPIGKETYENNKI